MGKGKSGHECLHEGDIEVFRDFKDRTERWQEWIGKWAITSALGLLGIAAGIVVIIVKVWK